MQSMPRRNRSYIIQFICQATIIGVQRDSSFVCVGLCVLLRLSSPAAASAHICLFSCCSASLRLRHHLPPISPLRLAAKSESEDEGGGDDDQQKKQRFSCFRRPLSDSLSGSEAKDVNPTGSARASLLWAELYKYCMQTASL